MPSLEDKLRLALAAERVALGRKLQTLWDGYGEIRRVSLEGVAVGGSVFESAIVKHVTPKSPPGKAPAALRSHRRKLRSYDVEQQFYARYAARCGTGCRVARPLHVERERGGWLFVLEDLDAAGFARRAHSLSELELSSCLAWLAEFHATFLGESPEGLWRVGCYWHLATRPDELAALDVQLLREHAAAFDAALTGAHYRTLVHGDAKPDNFCFGARGACAAVDFQYVGGGPGIRDVAYLLDGCLPASGRRDRVARHLDTYFGALERAVSTHSSGVDFAALEAEWRALFPVAWADFYRFLLGWAKDACGYDEYSRALTEEAVARARTPGKSQPV